MSKKTMILGYTRNGIEVLLPSHRSPDTDSFAGWTRGDHLDASRILVEHGEREQGNEVGSWCARWAKIHKDLRQAAKREPRIRGAAEMTVLAGRRR
jgi:hypothetical protein